jgi:hypothetical protein
LVEEHTYTPLNQRSAWQKLKKVWQEVAHSLVEANCREWKPLASLLFPSVCTELKKLAMENAGAMSTQDGLSMLVR